MDNNKLTFQKLDLKKQALGEAVAVTYNPTEYTLSKSAQFADVAIPGLDGPVIQFIRGEAEKLNLELLFDTTEKGMAAGATPVTTEVDKFYRLVKVDGDLHAPPIVRVTWGTAFPGFVAAEGETPVFDCVVESVHRKFLLFSTEGVPLRCVVTLALREYRTLEEQLNQINFKSADHTRVHVVSQDENLPKIAYDAYQDPARWRLIAEHNRLPNPRRLLPGTVLELPPTT
jgi:nucleoid-associated protein YgaU